VKAGKVLYAVAFSAVLPALLVLWAVRADPGLPLPVPGAPAFGWLVALCGAGLLIWGIGSVLRYGEGLPMNAYPPARLVTRGAYGVLRHPIYVGFSVLCFGAAIAARSSVGFWLIAPSVALASVALVLGYERLDFRRRFGDLPYRPWLTLPAVSGEAPSLSDRLAVCVLVLLPWVAVYESVAALAPARPAFEAYLAFERSWPVIEGTEALYAATYVFVLMAPFAAKASPDLRDFADGALLATALAGFLWIVLPVAAPPKPFVAAGPLGRLLLFERAHDVASNALPSFHATWALLSARAFASRWPRARPLWFGLAAGISVSCITTGMHAISDVVAGVALYLLVSRRGRVWAGLLRATEAVANSWREWCAGPLRLINHAAYAGVCGILIVGGVGGLLGGVSLPAVVALAACGVLGAALGAQLIEGGSGLLRPYGYFGAVAGALAASGAGALLWGWDGWRMAAAFMVVGPWIMAVGRLRCLVQGCCHGRPAPEPLGIRYRHPMSRVCRLTALAGLPVHPTQLYSILWNVALGLLLARLWSARAPLSAVVGVYLVLAGLGRFVEEAYRGEPQTPALGGLRLYQWLSVLSVVGGAVATAIPTGPAGGPWHSGVSLLLAAIAFGALAAIAYGVDFPKSDARLARLT
jgi:protein-S-isoprenylcysteine O-methyltransferase Ste14